MGGDGGSIPSRRDCIVVTKKDQKPEDPELVAQSVWSTCTLSQEPLVDPIVACQIGRLYNKDTMIQKHLLAEIRQPTSRHITSLKDLIPVKVKWDPEYKGDSDGVRLFVCPVTGVKANGQKRFIVMRQCGCVLSRKAYDEVPSQNCLACQAPVQPSDEDKAVFGKYCSFLPLYPEVEEEDAMRDVDERRKAHAKAEKKRKKKDKGQPDSDQTEQKKESKHKELKKRKVSTAAPGSAVAEAEARGPMGPLEAARARGSKSVMDNPLSRIAGTTALPPKDPRLSSQVFRSIFLTKEQKEAEKKKGYFRV